MKRCPACDTTKPLGDFYRNRARSDGRDTWCSACRLARNAASRSADPERHRSWERKAKYRRRYGITLERKREMAEAQGYRCAICGERQPSLQALHVDHDHQTMVVRQLLCAAHNKGLGHFADDPALLRAAASYLEAHGTLGAKG